MSVFTGLVQNALSVFWFRRTLYYSVSSESIISVDSNTLLNSATADYSINELDEIHRDANSSEVLIRAFYGYDAETFTTDRNGSKTYGAFNPNRDYFTYNGYGNLVSADYKDYSGYLNNWAIEAMSENRVYIDTIESDDDLSALFDELEAI